MPAVSDEPGLIASLWAWCEAHPGLLGGLFLGSLASLLLVALLLPVIVVRLPEDYFATVRHEPPVMHSAGYWIWRVGKNALGAVFLLAGFLMLFLPGQGLLTILIGLLLLEFPGKRRLERRLVQRPSILHFLNRLRERRGRPPLHVD
jgi:hypothetical protein